MLDGGGCGVYWRLYVDDTKKYPEVLHHLEYVLLPHIGEATQSLPDGYGEGLWILGCTISAGGPIPSMEDSSHPHLLILNW